MVNTIVTEIAIPDFVLRNPSNDARIVASEPSILG